MKRKNDPERVKLNRKRKLKDAPQQPADFESLDKMAQQARYEGSAIHKRNPGDFGLTPPAEPRPFKTLCDDINLFSWKEAERLLKEGLRKGLISAQDINGWPKHVWAVTRNGEPVEAIYGGGYPGTYHGYPMQGHDPFREKVLERWRQ